MRWWFSKFIKKENIFISKRTAFKIRIAGFAILSFSQLLPIVAHFWNNYKGIGWALLLTARFLLQSTYRGREEMGGGICPLSWSVLYNFVRDDRYNERGWACPTSSFAMLGWFFHHDGMYARKWPLPLCVYSVLLLSSVDHLGFEFAKFPMVLQEKAILDTSCKHSVCWTSGRD